MLMAHLFEKVQKRFGITRSTGGSVSMPLDLVGRLCSIQPLVRMQFFPAALRTEQTLAAPSSGNGPTRTR
jgi:hypothetical protein